MHSQTKHFITMQYYFIIIVITVIAACEEFESVVSQGAKALLQEENEYSEVPGEDASSFLAKAYKDSSVDTATLLELLSLNELEGDDEASLLENDPPEVSTGAVKALNAIQKSINNFKADDFSLNDNSYFTKESLSLSDDPETFANDTVNWTRSESEFTVSALEKMPARDQGRRGTCAAFAGIGQIEGYLIKQFGLDGIDLSEQRFYYMSKPEHWSDGGDKSSAGSNSGTGFAKSNGYEFDGHTYPPNSPEGFNIPLESDCPYNPKLGDNDLQTPQASGCETGVARVDDFTAWVYDWENRPKFAQNIYDIIANDDIPVVVATKLSANWEKNDGIITLADAGSVGDTGHASGHAYLVVGARKLDEAKYPNEGGMCFIIKNSWGKGWGVGGISCMTLAWFNEWRYPFGFPSIKSVSIDTEKIQVSKENGNTRPETIVEPDDETKTDINNPEKDQNKVVRRGTGSVSLVDLKLHDTSDMEFGSYLGDSDEFFKIFYKIEGELIYIRGLLDSDNQVSHELILPITDQSIFYEKSIGSQIQVGSLDSEAKTITLCSQEFSNICHFNYLQESNELTIGLTQNEFEKKSSAPPYSWNQLTIRGYGLEFSKPPGFNTEVDIRIVHRNKTTNPLRFSLDPLSGDVSFQRKTIGNITSVEFCSKKYADVCRLVVSDNDFHVFFKAGAN